jgi:hypothetical protein
VTTQTLITTICQSNLLVSIGERIADVSKDLSKVAGTAVRVAGCVPLFVVGHGLLNLPLYSLVGVGVGAGM